VSGWIGGEWAYRFLKSRYPGGRGTPMGSGEGTVADTGQHSKLDLFWGEEFFAAIRGKRVADFGCGPGWACLEMAERGAGHVYGIDIVDEYLEAGRRRASEKGLAERITFGKEVAEPVDIVHSMDAFEHFMDPAGILQAMRKVVRDDGEVWISFGYTWYHPLGGHLFSVFPWAHLIFTEEALVRWRSDFKNDGATRFGEVQGGLNQMTMARWERLVAESPFRIDRQMARPIRKLKWLHNQWTREFLTSTLQVVLKPR
jgi:SAM-dependent methyltransferase